MEKFISLSEPYLVGNEKKYVDECIDSTWISSVGRFVDRFETEFADYVGSKYAVAVTNGTAALHLAMIAAEIKPDDEVFVPAVTFIATANSVSYTGARPIFIDMDKGSLGMCPDKLNDFIKQNCEKRQGELFNRSTGGRIKAIAPVHLYGHACRMDRLMEIARENGLTVVEDAAQGIGCLVDGTHVGTIGDIGCFSFNGNKTLTTGGGGMIVTNDAAKAALVRHLSTQAKSDELYYKHDMIGYNYRMTNIQAAIGVAQLEKIDEVIRKKRSVHATYAAALAGVDEISLFTEQKWCRCGYWMAVLTIPEGNLESFIQHLKDKRIQCRPLWDLCNRQPMYADCQTGDLSIAEKLSARTVIVPCNQSMDDDDVSRVVDVVKSFRPL